MLQSIMKISIKVKPGSKTEKIEKRDNHNLILWVKAVAKENKANEAAIELLSQYFDTPKSLITILKGKICKNKVFNIKGI